MSKNIVQNGSRISITFSLRDEDKNIIFGDKEGKKQTLTLNYADPLFDLFKCLIGKEEGFSGKFKVNQQLFDENIEEYSIESLPSVLKFQKGTIIKIGSNNDKLGFIKEVKESSLIIETNKPFRHVSSILSILINKVD